MQNVVDKNNLQDTEVSGEIISSSTATAFSSKIIDIEMDLPASLSVRSVTASTPISGYRLIDMSILADVFLCYLVFLDVMVFNVLNFVTLMKKKKGLAKHLQFSCAVCLYSYAFFTSKQIDLPKKNKGEQKLYDVNVRAICGCRQVVADRFKKTLLLLEYA